MSEKPQKISIGFHGGQVLAARVTPEALRGLKAALGSEGWHDLLAEDGAVSLDLRRVNYVMVEDEEHRVGF
jgi:hypothetical protein